MKTNIGIELTDMERAQLAQNWFGRKTLVTRKEVTDFVNAKIQLALLGGHEDLPGAGGPRGTQLDDGPGRDQRLPDHDNLIAAFVPSRGDESYLLKPRDPALKDILSRMLDLAEEYEAYVWDKLEKNS